MIRLGVLDDHPVVLWGMEQALHGYGGINVVAQAASPDALDVTSLDVLLLDMYLGADIPSTSLVARFSLYTKIILMSATRNARDIDAGIRAGASEFVHKSATREEIAHLVRAVAAGADTSLSTQHAEAAAEQGSLSPRERQVVSMIASGLTHEQTARRMGISKHTVDTYVKRVRAKLKVGNKAELARLALHLAAKSVAR
jgi:DNA-binding NarL/FixJ family response regulator